MGMERIRSLGLMIKDDQVPVMHASELNVGGVDLGVGMAVNMVAEEVRWRKCSRLQLCCLILGMVQRAVLARQYLSHASEILLVLE